MSLRVCTLVSVVLVAGCGAKQPPPLPTCDRASAPLHVELSDGWRLRSSADVGADPITVSTLGFDTSRWYATSVPSTVSGTLALAGAAGGDPFVGMNLRNLP